MRKLQNQFDGKAVRFLLSGVALLASLPVLAVTAQSAEPWSERVIQSRPDLALGGVLTADQLKQLTEYGEHLFVGKFTVGDGVGRPLATQAIVPTKRKRAPESPFNRLAGMDSNACASCHSEPKIGGAGDFSVNVFVSEGFTNAEFDTSDPQFSNERNTNHVFGSGPDRIARPRNDR